MKRNTMKRTRIPLTFALVAATLLLAAPAALAAESPSYSQWIVTSAHVPVGGGTPPANFVSSLRIVNPNAQDTTVNLTFLKQTALDGSGNALGDNTGSLPITVTVKANQTLAIDDVIATLFVNVAPAGGIKIDSILPVSVLSQTLNINVANQGGAPGSDGLAIPGLTLDSALYPGDVGYIPYISSSADATTGKRSNLFLQSATSDGNTVVHVKLVKGDGSVVGERDLTLGKLTQTQYNGIAAKFGYTANDTNLTAILTVTSGGPVFAGASVNDNAVGSQYFAPASKAFTLRDGYDYGLVLNDGGYNFSGRLQVYPVNTGTPAAPVYTSQPDYISMGIVLETCPQPSPVLLFFFQAFGSGQLQNTTFSKNPDGSWTFNGTNGTASWAGRIFTNPDGTIYGSVTYSRAAGASDCPNVSRTFSFLGAPVARLT